MKLFIEYTGKNRATARVISDSEARQINTRHRYELRDIKHDPNETRIIKYLNNLRK